MFQWKVLEWLLLFSKNINTKKILWNEIFLLMNYLKYNLSSNDHNSLQSGIGKLTSSLFDLQNSSGKLLKDSLNLQSGITTKF